jgi:hypothetical protein
MSPLNVHLTELVAQLDQELGGADDLDKISEAQRRAHTLTDLGDQLVGHYVEQARASGASWTQIGDAIGVSKQAAQQRWVPGNYARFNQRARNIIVLAQEAARNRGDDMLGTEHLLIGLVGKHGGVAAKVLVELASSVDAIVDALPATDVRKRKKTLRGHLPLTEAAKQALSLASRESAALRHNFVGAEHILLGVLEVPEGTAAQALHELGIRTDAVRARMMKILDGIAE